MMKIRKAVIKDLKKIQELNLLLFEKEKKEYDKLMNPDWTFGEKGTKHFKNHLIKENFCAFVVEDAGKIVGYLVGRESEVESYRNAPKMAELNYMFVLKEHRGNGVGGMLYDAFVEWCKGRKVKLLRIEVSAGNEGAIEFYRKKGLKDCTLLLEREL